MIISQNLHNVRNENKKEVHCTIGINGQLEMFFALNAMACPERHMECDSWARKRYAGLSRKLQEEIRFMADHYAQWIFATDVIENLTGNLHPEDCNIETAVRLLRQMERNDFAYIFLGLSAFDYDKSMLDEWYAHPDELKLEELGEQQQFFALEDVVYLLKNTDEIKGKMIYVMEQYWKESFQYDWSYLESYERAMIEKEEKSLQELGVFEYIRRIHPDISVDQNRIYFHKEPDFYMDIDKIEEICINLSIFLNGLLGANIVGEKLYLEKSMSFHRAMASGPVPREMLDLFTVCSDETRMKMVKVLWNGHATTQKLAEILGMSSSTISQHLKQMKNANIVDSYKINKYVYYYMKQDSFENLMGWLMNYLEK